MLKLIKGFVSPFNITKVWLTVVITMGASLAYYYHQAKVASGNVSEYRLKVDQLNSQLIYAVRTGNNNADKLIAERERSELLLNQLLNMQTELDSVRGQYIEIEKEVIKYVEVSNEQVKSCFNTTIPSAVIDRLR